MSLKAKNYVIITMHIHIDDKKTPYFLSVLLPPDIKQRHRGHASNRELSFYN